MHRLQVSFSLLSTQPPTVACKMEAQLEYVHIAFTFLHVWRRFGMLSQRLLTKFLHWSSVGSLLRVHCWLGKQASILKKKICHFHSSQPFPQCATSRTPPPSQEFATLTFPAPSTATCAKSASVLRMDSWCVQSKERNVRVATDPHIPPLQWTSAIGSCKKVPKVYWYSRVFY